MLLVLVLLMSLGAEAAGPAVTVRPPVHDTSGPAVQPRAAAALMIGRWQLLGPATQAETILMVELTLQAAEPTVDQMEAARLSPEARAQVFDARMRAALEPNSAELTGMRRLLAALPQNTFTIGPNRIESRLGGAADVLSYTVVESVGLSALVEATDAKGRKQPLRFTVPEPTMMLMGPPGAEPLVLRRLPDAP